MANFIVPEIWHFPPFFTLQPVLETRTKQLDQWRDLIISYCSFNHITRISIQNFALFCNKSIERKLSPEGIHAVVEHLIKSDHALLEPSNPDSLLVFPKTLVLLASELYDWAVDHQLVNTVATVFELYSGEEHPDCLLTGMDPFMVRLILQTLERQNKCVIISGASSDEDGVKFLP